jgi:thiamine-monophosphate kinase
VKGVDEFALIRLLTERKLPNEGQSGVFVGIGDDAAVAAVSPGFHLVLSCDTMVQETHFKKTTMKCTDIGYKAMASSISDMAAMGAIPRYALVSLSTHKETPVQELQELYDGLYECAEQFDVAVVGGDTTSTSGVLTVSVTIIGEVEPGKALLRSAARLGDVVFITGCLGSSAAGLDYLLTQNRDANGVLAPSIQIAQLMAAHQRPQPQVKAGRLLLQSGLCHALNDISDGLASEAWEIAEASGCGIRLQEKAIPIEPSLQAYADEQGKQAMEWIMYGGEDYQLLGTVPADQAAALQAEFQQRGLCLYVIGEVTSGKTGVELLRADGVLLAIEKKGYNHF